MSFWNRDHWLGLRQSHLTRVAAAADAFVQRRSREQKHPVHDFLFTYYSFSPAKLKQWLPPQDVTLEITAPDLIEMPWLLKVPVIHENGCLQLNRQAIKPHVKDLARWVMTLCENVQNRAPRFRCFGLHEWAMVYQQSREEIRHQGYELRLSPEVLASFVESQSICCSHYDAFRFFTPAAKPMNVLQPILDTRLEMEQGACLHANMDLYKWASKLWPWVGSDLIGECFHLAQEGRDLDMRASPYDLAHLGYQPVFIETVEGRTQYEQEQRSLAAKAEPVRQRLRQAAKAIAES